MDTTDDRVETRNYILSLCSALGAHEELPSADGTRQYSVGDEALACLRDLKRAIRVDSEYKEKTVLNTIAEFNIIESDIVPLMLSFEGQSTEIANRFILACVELLVPMTWPIEKSLDDEEEDEYDPNMIDCYRKYKLGLLKPGVFEVILRLVEPAVRIPYR
ncbi:timeless-domain-containing protein [Rhizopus microsporus var. microsporus]|uniref:Timeless-domain-containing protein n=2 Tax=Rhizopus microsporus TaxID=58291 RepID=A0A1X0S1Y8_RHIZD|nr:timeless-domain-containing protein [Rhizopus microsporus var. microsporus]ORE18191.1 timeless-domain-containing protein [Rhizopus microsporus]